MAAGTAASLEATNDTDRFPSQNLNHRRARWIHLLRDRHYEPVIHGILSEELPKYTSSRVIDPTNITSHMRECALILASAPQVFFAAVEGSLVSRIRHDVELQSEHAELLRRARVQPSIYVHLLADEQGLAPTPVQYLLICEAIRLYLDTPSSAQASTHAHANAIDCVTPPLVSSAASAQGHRKYLCTPRTLRSPSRLAAFGRLVAGVTARYTVPEHFSQIPIAYPPAEVGYSLHAPMRLAQHRAHRSSNVVMNLVEDVCTHLFRSNILPQHFTLHQFVIFLCWRREQARIAEIFVSGILQSWVEAGGMNAWPAGRSVASVESIGEGEWNEFVDEAMVEGVGERMEGLRDRAGRWLQALEWQGEERKPSDVYEQAVEEGQIS